MHAEKNKINTDLITWDADFVDKVTMSHYPWITFHFRVYENILLDNIEWREDADGYQSSSCSHFSFATNATELLFDAVDYVHYGELVTPVILVDDIFKMRLPNLPENEKSLIMPLSLPAGEKKITVINSLQTNCSWGGIPKSYVVRSIYSNAPLVLVVPCESVRKRLVIYGDSIVAGDHADIPGIRSWGTLLRQYYDVAFEASGWKRLQDDMNNFAMVASRISSYHPNVIWLAIGTNDFQGPDNMDIKKYSEIYRNFINILHQYSPASTIIAQSPLVTSNANIPNAAGNILADYRIAIQNATTDCPWCNYIDGSKILKLSDLADGIHPNTPGMAKYAEWVKRYLFSL